MLAHVMNKYNCCASARVKVVPAVRMTGPYCYFQDSRAQK